ncbi:MAG TPA: DUF1573 domain-containing protein [Phycisphaerales bacterium]|nr:DUF1573 domain-containing protein [Phycisphaerales bacterium]HRQ76204.1 DUF1573 domain-containing protein [Phycisphaerales bacterium]
MPRIEACSPSSVETTSDSSAGGRHSIAIHDFGEVELRPGLPKLVHRFVVANHRRVAIEILDVRKTCGCVDFEISATHIEPGKSVVVTLAMDMNAPGVQEQAASLILSTGDVYQLVLRAQGIVTREFRVVPLSSFPDKASRLPLQFYLIDNRGDGYDGAPKVIQPDHVAVKFDGWVYIERHSALPLRPTRQLASGSLDFSQYSGGFPMEIVIGLDDGSQVAFMVNFEPRDQEDCGNRGDGVSAG